MEFVITSFKIGQAPRHEVFHNGKTIAVGDSYICAGSISELTGIHPAKFMPIFSKNNKKIMSINTNNISLYITNVLEIHY